MYIPVAVPQVWAEWTTRIHVIYMEKSFTFVKDFFNVVNGELWIGEYVEMEFGNGMINDYMPISN